MVWLVLHDSLRSASRLRCAEGKLAAACTTRRRWSTAWRDARCIVGMTGVVTIDLGFCGRAHASWLHAWAGGQV